MKYFLMFMLLTSVVSPATEADPTNLISYQSDLQVKRSICEKKTDPEKTACENKLLNDQKGSACEAKRSRYEAKLDNFHNACKDAKVNQDVRACVKEALSCAKENESSTSKAKFVLQALTTTLGTSAANAPQDEGSGCAKYTSDKYDSLYEKFKSEKVSINEKLNGLSDEIKRSQEDYNRTNKTAREGNMEGTQKDAEKKTELAEKEKSAITQLEENANKAKETIDGIEKTQIELHAKMKEQHASYTRKLDIFNEANKARNCNSTVMAKAAALRQGTSGSSGSAVSSAKMKKRELTALYQQCMADLDAQLLASIREWDSAKRAYDLGVSTLNEQKSKLEATIRNLATDIGKAKADISQQKLQVDKQATARAESNYADVVAAKKVLDSAQAALAAKQKDLNNQLNAATNNLNSLGPKPVGETRGTTADIISSMGSLRKDLSEFTKCCDSRLGDEVCDLATQASKTTAKGVKSNENLVDDDDLGFLNKSIEELEKRGHK